MIKIKVDIQTPEGLHARPASLFVKTAAQFRALITVAKEGKEVDGKRLLALMTLGVKKGDQIEISAQGPDEKEAIQALQSLFDTNFSE